MSLDIAANETLIEELDRGGGGGGGGPSSSEVGTQTLVKSDSSSPSSTERESATYHLKWIKFKGNKCPIITQNENGPCPLIAIVNVLLLKARIRFSPAMEIITSQQLMEYLGDCILSSIPKNVSEEVQLNYEQNMHDAIAVLPKLQTGLDVNVRFSGTSDFEYTPELIVFDLLHIPLYHGWLVDPEQLDVMSAVCSYSYNQLVDKIITNKTSPKTELVAEALIAEQFLEKTASQLTYYGLSELISNIKDGKLGVLFRNNHFITLYKHNGQLFQLVTDQGFLTEASVVWETLSNIDNDGQFVDFYFVPVPPKPVPLANSQQQVDQDYLIALSLQEEGKKAMETEKEWEELKRELGAQGLSDEELARKLQIEEEKRYKDLQEPEIEQAEAAEAEPSERQKADKPDKGKSAFLPNFRVQPQKEQRRLTNPDCSPHRKSKQKDEDNPARSGKKSPGSCYLL